MATLGTLVLAVKTSGIPEAMKQLEELDKSAQRRAKSQAEATGTGGAAKRQIDEEAKARAEAVKKREADELAAMRRVQEQERQNSRERAQRLKEDIEQRMKMEKDAAAAKAREEIEAARAVAREQAAATKQAEKDIAAELNKDTARAGGGGGGGFGRMFNVIGAAAAGRLVAAVADGIPEAMRTSRMGGNWARAAESMPIVGGLFRTGREIKEETSGLTQAREIRAFAIEEMGIRRQSQQFTQTESSMRHEAARQEYSQAVLALDVRRRNLEITEEQAEALNEALAAVRDAKFAEAEFQRRQEFGGMRVGIAAQGFQAEEITKARGGDVFGTEILKEQNRLTIVGKQLALDLNEARRRGDTEREALLTKSFQAEQQTSQAKIDFIETERSRMRSVLSDQIVGGQIALSLTKESTDEQVAQNRQFQERHAIQTEINRLTQLENTLENQKFVQIERQKLAASDLAESRRRFIVEFQRNQVQAGLEAEVAATDALIGRQGVLAAEIQRHAQIDARIRDEKRLGHDKEAAQLETLRSRQDAMATQRNQDAVQDIRTQTEIQRMRNSGVFNPFQQRIAEIREDFRKRMRDAGSDEVRSALRDQEKEAERTALREALSPKVVSSTEAKFTAFGNRAQKPAEAILKKQLDALDRIVENTSRPYAIAA